MRVSIVEGNNHQDILNAQLELVKKGLSDGKKQYFVVPDRFSLDMEKFVLNGLGLRSSFDIEVFTLPRLASRTINLGTKRALTSLGATMIMQSIINDCSKELRCFTRTSKTINFASIIFDSIAQLKSCGITPNALSEGAMAQNDVALRDKMLDISLIYARYEDYIRNDYVDSTNKLQLLQENLIHASIFDNCDVHICRFDNMTELGYSVVSQIIRASHSVSIGALVPDVGQNNANVYTQSHHTKIMQVCRELCITPNIISTQCTMNDIRRHMLSNIFAYEPESQQLPRPFLQLYEAGTPSIEVDFVAKDILRKVRTKGVRYRDINIDCTDLASYAPILRQTFGRYNIPCWIDMPFKLQDTELYKLLNAIFSAISNNFDKKSILRFIKNPLVMVDRATQELVERVINRYGLEYDLIFRHLDGLNDDVEYVEYCQAIANHLGVIADFADMVKDATTVGQYVVSVNMLIDKLHLSETLESFADKANSNGDLQNQSIYRQSLAKVQKVLDEMLQILAEFDTSWDNFVSIFDTGINSVELSIMPMSLDCVYIGQSLQSLFDTSPTMYVLGASNGKLPSWVLDIGLITDKDISMLEEQRVKIEPSIREVNARSKEAVLMELCTPTDELIISYPLQINGEKNLPSTVMTDLSKSFSWQGMPISIVSIDALLSQDDVFGGKSERYLFNWSNYDNMLRDLVQSVRQNLPIDERILATAQKCLLDVGYGAFLQRVQSKKSQIAITSSTAKKLFFAQKKASVTELEKYFSCPYLHFLEYGLKLSEDKTSNIDSLDIGTILHAVLENYTRLIKSKGMVADENVDAVAQKIFDQVMSAPEYVRFVATGQNDNMLLGLKKECVRVCRAINYQQSHSKYDIRYIEASFGSANFVPVPEIAVVNTDIAVHIKGKIDRVDYYSGKYRVVDYKTSKNAGKFSLVAFYIGKKIQLFYYAYAMIKALREKGEQASIGGVYYLPVHREYVDESDGGEYAGYKMDGITLGEYSNLYAQDDSVNFDHPKSDIIPFAISKSKDAIEANDITRVQNSDRHANREQFEAMLEYSQKVITKAILELADGYITPKPIKGACEYCNYKNICRIACGEIRQERSDNYDIDVESFGGLD